MQILQSFVWGGPEENPHRYLEIPTCSSVEEAARTEGCSTVAVGDLGLPSAHWS